MKFSVCARVSALSSKKAWRLSRAGRTQLPRSSWPSSRTGLLGSDLRISNRPWLRPTGGLSSSTTEMTDDRVQDLIGFLTSLCVRLDGEHAARIKQRKA